jgi:hypothetical protein
MTSIHDSVCACVRIESEHCTIHDCDQTVNASVRDLLTQFDSMTVRHDLYVMVIKVNVDMYVP